jgi:hypothetical protein
MSLHKIRNHGRHEDGPREAVDKISAIHFLLRSLLLANLRISSGSSAFLLRAQFLWWVAEISELKVILPRQGNSLLLHLVQDNVFHFTLPSVLSESSVRTSSAFPALLYTTLPTKAFSQL